MKKEDACLAQKVLQATAKQAKLNKIFNLQQRQINLRVAKVKEV